jgi:hypothetical protein
MGQDQVLQYPANYALPGPTNLPVPAQVVAFVTKENISLAQAQHRPAKFAMLARTSLALAPPRAYLAHLESTRLAGR